MGGVLIPADDKTEKATPKRREDERKKGNIFQSQDVTSALGLLGIFGFLYAVKNYVFGYFMEITKNYLSGFRWLSGLTAEDAARYTSEFALHSLVLSLPFALVAAVLGMVFDVAQTRMNFSAERIKFNLRRLNPLSGLKNVFSARSLVELIKSIIKVTIASLILYTELKNRMPEFMSLSDYEVLDSINWIFSTIFAIVIKIGLVMLAFAVLDYLYQWWDYERQIKMTKQEIKEEYKQTEGDPHIKSRRQEQHRRMVNARMMQKVPTADVVVKNPTHFAVALKYDATHDRAPIVVAKGQDYLALKIIEVAEKSHVVVTENRPLARGLYAAVKVGQEIPEEYYQAVAEVLAFVYNLRRGGRQA